MHRLLLASSLSFAVVFAAAADRAAPDTATPSPAAAATPPPAAPSTPPGMANKLQSPPSADAKPKAGAKPKADAPKADIPKADATPKTDAKKSAAELRKISDTYFKQCMQDWDAATHMTKKEWERTCRRVVDSRAKFMLEQMDK